jgi:hypothetical protein
MRTVGRRPSGRRTLNGARAGILATLLVLVAGACGSTEPEEVVFQVIEETTFGGVFINSAGDTLTIDLGLMTVLPSGVYIQDLVLDTLGALLAGGDLVSVDHTGWLSDGAAFSFGQFGFVHLDLPPQVIPGFDAGLVGMRVGGTRLMIIPPAQGYGALPNPPIPGGSILIFEVEVLGVL